MLKVFNVDFHQRNRQEMWRPCEKSVRNGEVVKAEAWAVLGEHVKGWFILKMEQQGQDKEMPRVLV